MYNTGSTKCECGSEQTDHIIICSLNSVTCTLEDLKNASDAAISLSKQWSRKGIWQAFK